MTHQSTIELIHSPNAILHKFGMNLFQAIDSYLTRGEKVSLSFSGIQNVTSGFMNASFGNLYKKYGYDLDDLLEVQDFENQDWKEKKSLAKLLALEPDKARILDDAIVDLFN